MPAAALRDDQLDLVFHALANRTRRALVKRLSTGSARVGDLAAPFGMSLNAISKHLLVLEGAGLIDRKVSGREHICALKLGAMATAEQWIESYTQFWHGKLDQLAQFVEEDKS